MKHRLIFPAYAALRQGEMGWFFVVKLGQQEFSFLAGQEKPEISSPVVNIILEYRGVDAEPSTAPIE